LTKRIGARYRYPIEAVDAVTQEITIELATEKMPEMAKVRAAKSNDPQIHHWKPSLPSIGD
jgi:hypothetical protein